MNHQTSNQEHPNMNDNTLETLLENWEHDITGVPKHWEKSDKRKAIDKKYKAQLTQMVKEIIGSEEDMPMHIDYQVQAIARNEFRKAAIERARKYGLEIEDE